MASKQINKFSKIDQQIVDAYTKRVDSPTDTLNEIERILITAKEQRYNIGLANALIVKADSLRRVGKYNESENECNKALSLCESLPYHKGELEAKYQIALLLKYNKKPAEAYLAFRSLLNQVNEYPSLKSKIKYQIGLIYILINKKNEGLKILEEGLEIEKTDGDDIGLCYFYVNIARLYIELSDFKNAIRNINLALECAKHDGIKADVSALKGLYLFLCDNESSNYESEFDFALKILIKRKSPVELMNLYFNLGQISSATNKSDQSIEYCNKGIVIANDLERDEDKKFGFYILSNAYAKIEKHKEAYDYLLKSDGISVIELGSKRKIYRKGYYFLINEIEKINLEIERELYVEEYSKKSWSRRLNFLISKIQSNEYNDKIVRKLSLNPEILFGRYDLSSKSNDNQVKFENIDCISDLQNKQILVFHALSPAGENISYIASIGRDLSNANLLKANELRYVQQGLNWAYLNHSLNQILFGVKEEIKSQIVENCINQRIIFFKLFDLNKLNNKDLNRLPFNIQYKVLDYIPSSNASNLIVINDWMEIAAKILEMPKISDALKQKDKAKIQNILDEVISEIELSSVDNFEKQFSYKKSDCLLILRNLSGLLNIKAFSRESLIYYFMQNKYVFDFYSNIIRFGPFEEKNWDTPIKYMIKYNNEENYKIYSGIYTKSWSFNGIEGLPYSYVSGNVINELRDNTITIEDLYFIGDNKSNLLSKLTDYELIRLLSDTISFTIFASLFDAEFKNIINQLPSIFKGEIRNLNVTPGSDEYVSFIKNSIDLNMRSAKDNYCPASLLPYLLTNEEIEQNRNEIIEFINAVNIYMVKYLLPKQVDVINNFLRSINSGKTINVCKNNHHFIDSELCPFCNEEVESQIERMEGDCIFCGQLCPIYAYGCNIPNETS